MTKVEQIIKLSELGYTRDEINNLLAETPDAAATPAVSDTVQEQAPTASEVEWKPEAKPEAHTGEKPQAVYQLTQEQIRDLVQGVAVKTTGGVFETPKDISVTLGEHLESLLKGE